MEIAIAPSQWRRGHEPGDRPTHCRECSERWPCDWTVLCEEVEERDAQIAALEAALRDIAQAASEAADALAMHDPTTHSRLALQGCFEAIADAALAALEELHD